MAKMQAIGYRLSRIEDQISNTRWECGAADIFEYFGVRSAKNVVIGLSQALKGHPVVQFFVVHLGQLHGCVFLLFLRRGVRQLSECCVHCLAESKPRERVNDDVTAEVEVVEVVREVMKDNPEVTVRLGRRVGECSLEQLYYLHDVEWRVQQ
ncbi:hypothetical protein PENTCL1PPCAC_4333, partial [Pristionchus entomophagus]